MKITRELYKSEFKKVVDFFKKREQYKKDLRKFINKYGVVNLTPAMQRSMPTNIFVLYELPWYLNIIVLIRIPQIAWHSACKEAIRRAINV